jgi:hypothetical protein
LTEVKVEAVAAVVVLTALNRVGCEDDDSEYLYRPLLTVVLVLSPTRGKSCHPNVTMGVALAFVGLPVGVAINSKLDTVSSFEDDTVVVVVVQDGNVH